MKNQTPKTQTSDLRPPKLRPLDIFFKDIHVFEKKRFTFETRLDSYYLMFYGHAMLIGNRQKEVIYLSSLVYPCHVDQTLKD